MSKGVPSKAEGNPPRVSVVIPAYRVTEFIGDTLSSVFNQTYTDYEVIVVNDGCPDTPGLERAIAPYRDRIRYIVQANGGPSKARNTAIRAARGSLIAQLDGDDQWFPGFLASQVQFLDEHPDVDVVFSDAVVVGGPHDGQGFFEINHTAGPMTLAALMSLRVVVLASSMAGRRECLERVGLYDESLRVAEDFDFWLRLAAAGCRLDYHGDVLVRYRRDHEGLTSNEPVMMSTSLTVLARAERTMALSPEERQACVEGQRLIRSHRSLKNGQIAMRRGDAAEARREFADVKPPLASIRLMAVRAALRVAPHLTVAAYRRIKGYTSFTDA
jgi:glycosyltransferase involved in cell wall biosynthesis